MTKKILFICPTYGHFEYAELACASFFKHTPKGEVLLIDDASPDWDSKFDQAKFSVESVGGKVSITRRRENKGLTAAWNDGLNFAAEKHFDYAICGNSDIVFTPHWYESLKTAISAGWAVAGPVTNAAGPTAKGLQQVEKYVQPYTPSYRADDLKRTADFLNKSYKNHFIKSPINGFFLFSRTAIWHRLAYKKGEVFDPKYRMTLNEDRFLQRIWKKRKYSCICPGSYIFHFRSVSRGRKFCRDMWMRL